MQRLAGKVVDAMIEAPLNKVAVQLHKLRHLALGHDLLELALFGGVETGERDVSNDRNYGAEHTYASMLTVIDGSFGTELVSGDDVVGLAGGRKQADRFWQPEFPAPGT